MRAFTCDFVKIWVSLLIAAQTFETQAETNETESCKSENVDMCLWTLESVLEDQFMNLRQTDEDLYDNCGDSILKIECFSEMVKECKKVKPLSSIASVFKDLLDQLCDPASKKRALYLDNVECLSKHHTELEACTTDKEMANEEANFESENKENCRKDYKIKNCLENTAKEMCKKSGQDAMKMVMAPWNALISHKCDGHVIMTSSILVFASLLNIFTYQ